MPHPLPEDIDNVSGLKWFLAAVPDDPAFTRAAWDVFTDLANYWKWGKEGPVPEDSDKAAQLWADAVYETIEAYQMGFPDVLLGYIDEIEGLLRSLELISCCSDTSVTGDTVISDITPDVGDPPATWGENETVTDWEDWRQLVCGASDAWVSHLIAQVDDIETYLDAGLLVIGVVTALLAAGAGAGILIAIKYSVAVEAFAAIAANANNLVFQNIQNGLESARADIRCAIFDGCEDLETVIESAVGPLAWSSWYQFYDWCSIRNSLLEGQFNGGFHAVSRSELCSCDSFEGLFVARHASTGGDLFTWDGTQYVARRFVGDGGSPLEVLSAQTLRCKGDGAGNVTFAMAGANDGTGAQERELTFDIAGANGSTINYSVRAADGTILSSGTSVSDQDARWPLVVSGAQRAQFVQSGFQIGAFPAYWLNIGVA